VQCPVFLLGFLSVNRFDISEAIILEGVSDDFNVVVLKLKVITAVGRKKRSDRHRVFIRPEFKIVPLYVTLRKRFYFLLRF